MINKIKESKLFKFIKDNYQIILLLLSLIIINLLAFKKINSNIDTLFTKKYGNIIILLFTLLHITLLGVATLLFKKKKALEKIFLLVMIPIGICYIIIIPLGRTPDEYTHAKRAYEISEGVLVTSYNKEFKKTGRYLSRNMTPMFEQKNYNTYKEVFKIKDTKEKNFKEFASASLYSFFCYIPQAIGIFIGRTINLPLIFQFYLGRLFSFLTWVILIYYSIKLIPYKKLFIFTSAFIPMMIQQAISISADSITNGISFFLVAYTLYLKEKKGTLEKKEYILLIISTVILSMCKIVYLPLCLILFILPHTKFKSKKDKYIKIGILAFVVILLNLSWLLISSSYIVQSNSGANPTAQVNFILNNPLTYLIYCFNSVYYNLSMWIETFLGASMCLYDVPLSNLYVLLLFLVFLFVLLFDNVKKVVNQDKLLLGFITLSTILLIFTSLFVQWTPVNSFMVIGIQGRYFIPLLIPISLLLNFPKVTIKDGINMKTVTYILIFINIYALSAIFYGHL